ncbi:MAG: WbqC family protein [Chitinophagaceae bacterium]|nr:WbqC family protein [Chitinophagaceae bacterium]
MSVKTLLLDSEYFPGIAWFQLFLQYEQVYIEQHEYFVRATMRNRCFITGPNGVMSLSVPLKGGRNQKTLMKDIEISYAEDWVKDHLRSLDACYRRTPYYEYYEPELNKVFSRKHKFLMDLNLDTISLLCSWLKLKKDRTLTDKYQVPAMGSEILDARAQFTVAGREGSTGEISYIQPFQDRMGFVSGLSTLDAVFCCGNTASSMFNKPSK